ncbi:Protein prenyltransferase alpha subunit repeat family protein [Babesia bovis T2Bo]|uniref:Protein prenyltransferase alpha subunit repeat family protein n=1 Tax=Babesia bovis T2Bo TaxID=484906 RepID=UPI001C3569DE|nr:Protein prenyltransferase alpha subunit repeat family protein [Babesia bovis T2Bo]EDO07820.2 Protein prenyltransferase alpha subunit repeat family protein [Babesia bovis T2Bo]
MEDNISRIRENEGVIHTVRSDVFGYPCEPLVPDYSLLDDAESWSDINAALGDVKLDLDGLFRIRSDHTDNLIAVYMAHLISTQEYSSRGLYISSLAIMHNAANYTAWSYRMDCCLKMKLPLKDEITFARRVAYESPKSYQAWQYRRWLCDTGNTDHDELEYVKLEIATSPKNHCAWGYMTWLMQRFVDTKEQVLKELEFVHFLLESDIYNNTVWFYKDFIVFRYGHLLGTSCLVQEYIGDIKSMLMSPWNESLSQYLAHCTGTISAVHPECLNMDTCQSGCAGGPSRCLLGAIESSGVVTTALLNLKLALNTEPAERLVVQESLRLNDCVRTLITD